MIKYTLNGETVEQEEVTTILESASKRGVSIPTLCHNEHLTPTGSCRMCLVEVSTEKRPDRIKLVPSCTSTIADGMIVNTETDRIRKSRRFIISMLLSRSPKAVELKKLAERVGLPENREEMNHVERYLLEEARPVDDGETLCILCGLCVQACAEIPMRDAISFSERGMRRKVKTPFDKYADTCIGCGSCAYVCPTNAIVIEEVV